LHARAFPADQAWGEHAISMMLALAGSFGALCPDRGLVLARVVAGEGEILTLAVVPEWRRQRLASALMAYALKEAGDRGAGAMLLEVADTNAAAIGLYRGLGFATVGRRRRYYPGGGDALVLRRGLD
jgi:ribosomal-protein-alanine N-acetyltransferase